MEPLTRLQFPPVPQLVVQGVVYQPDATGHVLAPHGHVHLLRRAGCTDPAPDKTPRRGAAPTGVPSGES